MTIKNRPELSRKWTKETLFAVSNELYDSIDGFIEKHELNAFETTEILATVVGVKVVSIGRASEFLTTLAEHVNFEGNQTVKESGMNDGERTCITCGGDCELNSRGECFACYQERTGDYDDE